jgi:hypothetical protein
VGNSSAPA